MRRLARAVSTLAVAALLAAACGGGGDDSEDGTTESSTTTTSANVATTTSASSDDGEEQPVSTAPLTGVTVESAQDLDHAAVVVKIGNNDDRARPQAGLLEADIVFEKLIEGLKTRLAAVFHSQIPDRIGPVRSGRSGDIDLMQDLGTPYLSYSGANANVLGQFREAEQDGVFVDVGILAFEAPYTRDGERSAPDNLYVDMSLVDVDNDGRPQPVFEYGDDSSVGTEPVGITVLYPTSFGRESTHVWDPELRGWSRIQDGTLHTAETSRGEVEIAPANVVVAIVEYAPAVADPESPRPITFGSGAAWVLTRGEIFEGTWTRADDGSGWMFEDLTGAAIELTPGGTWMLLANADGGPFAAAEISVLEAEAAAAAIEEARGIPAGNEADSP